MEKPTKIITLIILVFLLCISCFSPRYANFVNLTAKELSSETQLTLNMTRPVQYTDIKLANSPFILINFQEKDVYCSEKDEIEINKGPIKRIKYGYYKTRKNTKRFLNFILVELTRDLPCKISNRGSSIIIAVRNTEQSKLKDPMADPKEKERREDQPKIGDLSVPERVGYLIGPGDVLTIEVWRHPDVSREVVINHLGEITLPPVRKMSVQGLTIPQLEKKMAEFLSKYLIDPVVSVTIKKYNSQRVAVIGEKTSYWSPGMFTLRRRTTLIEFISEIGGPSDKADFSRIKLIKKDGSIFTYDLIELLHDPKKSNEVILEGGDAVYFPSLELNKVYVLGEVNYPKSVPLKGGITLVDAITEAGGYTSDAVIKSILVIRGEVGSQKGIRVNLERILKKSDIGQNIELKPGDIVYVPRTFIANVEKFLRLMSAPILWILAFT